MALLYDLPSPRSSQQAAGLTSGVGDVGGVKDIIAPAISDRPGSAPDVQDGVSAEPDDTRGSLAEVYDGSNDAFTSSPHPQHEALSGSRSPGEASTVAADTQVHTTAVSSPVAVPLPAAMAAAGRLTSLRATSPRPSSRLSRLTADESGAHRTTTSSSASRNSAQVTPMQRPCTHETPFVPPLPVPTCQGHVAQFANLTSASLISCTQNTSSSDSNARASAPSATIRAGVAWMASSVAGDGARGSSRIGGAVASRRSSQSPSPPSSSPPSAGESLFQRLSAPPTSSGGLHGGQASASSASTSLPVDKADPTVARATPTLGQLALNDEMRMLVWKVSVG